jgi:hypothetical protein
MSFHRCRSFTSPVCAFIFINRLFHRIKLIGTCRVLFLAHQLSFSNRPLSTRTSKMESTRRHNSMLSEVLNQHKTALEVSPDKLRCFGYFETTLHYRRPCRLDMRTSTFCGPSPIKGLYYYANSMSVASTDGWSFGSQVRSTDSFF